jgi:hypothetical protein
MTLEGDHASARRWFWLLEEVDVDDGDRVEK